MKIVHAAGVLQAPSRLQEGLEPCKCCCADAATGNTYGNCSGRSESESGCGSNSNPSGQGCILNVHLRSA